MPNTKPSSNKDFKEENEILKGTIANITQEYDQVYKTVKSIEDHYTKGLRSVDPDAEQTKERILAGLSNYLIDKNHEGNSKHLEELKFQIKNPYFARIVFKKKGDQKPQDIYIGRHTFLKNSPHQTIVDWRAPVSSLYYNYLGPVHNASYSFKTYENGAKTPKTTELNGELELRRRIEIENGELLKIHDTSENIDLLKEALDNKTGGVLETIIESIQAEQNRVIREDLNTPIIVQGVAGSGKTTIAIHKISYLIYTYNTILNEKNILLLLNSKILARYVKTTLADLGIDQPHIFSLRYLISKTLKKFNDPYKGEYFDLEKDTMHIFDSDQLLKDLNKYSYEYSNQFIKKVNNILKSKRYLIQDQDFINNIYAYAKSMIKQLEKDINELDVFEDLINKSEQKADKTEILEEKISKLKDFLKEFKLTTEYEEFLKKYSYKLDRNNYSYLLGMFLFAEKLWGDYIPNGKYNYVMVDEGQDYTELEYLVISKLANNGRINIFGDVNQSTTKLGLSNNWDKIIEILNSSSERTVHFFNLETSYRNTKQITELNNKILGKFPENKYLPKAYNRIGITPSIENSENREKILPQLAKDLEKMSREKFKSACIIDLSETEVEKTKAYLLAKGLNVTSIDKNIEEFHTETIYICTPSDAKGLEFSSIFILDAEDSGLSNDLISARKLYVMCSRALNNLKIYSVGKIDKLLS